jgi:hypothetical protein
MRVGGAPDDVRDGTRRIDMHVEGRDSPVKSAFGGAHISDAAEVAISLAVPS